MEQRTVVDFSAQYSLLGFFKKTFIPYVILEIYQVFFYKYVLGNGSD